MLENHGKPINFSEDNMESDVLNFKKSSMSSDNVPTDSKSSFSLTNGSDLFQTRTENSAFNSETRLPAVPNSMITLLQKNRGIQNFILIIYMAPK